MRILRVIGKALGIVNDESLRPETLADVRSMLNNGQEIKNGGSGIDSPTVREARQRLAHAQQMKNTAHKLEKMKDQPKILLSAKQRSTHDLATHIGKSLYFLTRYKVNVRVVGCLYHKKGWVYGPVRIWVGNALATGTLEGWDTACDVRVVVGEGDNEKAFVDLARFTVVETGIGEETTKVFFKYKEEIRSDTVPNAVNWIIGIATDAVEKYLAPEV